MCSPCGPMICYKFEDTNTKNVSKEDPRSNDGGAEKKDNKDHELKRIKSRELRAGIMYYSCHCIKRNGLQHDCRRTGCGGEPTCVLLPDPMCAPSQLARRAGLADPAPLSAHLHNQNSGATPSTKKDTVAGPSSGGKKFIVCELKGMFPDGTDSQSSGCSKSAKHVPAKTDILSKSSQQKKFAICICPDLHTSKNVVQTFENTQYDTNHVSCMQVPTRFVLQDVNKNSPPTKDKTHRSAAKDDESICSRPNCVHWKPPPPCVWDAPCKADCFETRPGIQPGLGCQKGKIGGGTGGPGAGAFTADTKQMPMIIMKLC